MRLSLVRSLVCRLLAVVGLSLSIVPSARAGVANSGIRRASRSNPIARVQWGIYRGPSGGLYSAYQAAKGRDKAILANLALKPIVQPLGFWDSNAEIDGAVHEIVEDTTAGNPDVMSEISTFALNPWEGGACDGSWNVGSDESWYRQLARGIGSARMLAIVQVDMPFALCTSSPAPEEITAYGAQTLSALPHTTVYIDAGAAEWEPATRMANLLIRSGIRHVRGFSLNDSQYGATGLELQYGAQIIAALNADGVQRQALPRQHRRERPAVSRRPSQRRVQRHAPLHDSDPDALPAHRHPSDDTRREPSLAPHSGRRADRRHRRGRVCLVRRALEHKRRRTRPLLRARARHKRRILISRRPSWAEPLFGDAAVGGAASRLASAHDPASASATFGEMASAT